MKIADKLNFDPQKLHEHGPINIVFFGDSVTHGFFADNEIDYDAAYPSLLRKMILEINNYTPINIINAGIGGTTATRSLDRMQSQVFNHKPDLLIICFGLNDVNGSLEDYINSLKTIFEKCISLNVDAIFMTPNMLNTYVADDTSERYLAYANKTAEIQNSGRMDKYMCAATELANDMGITVCDCYKKWKELSKSTDTTMLLANRINHPTRQMHKLFAQSLFETIFDRPTPNLTLENSGNL